MNIDESFKILGITPEDDFNKAKEAYHLLVQVWHPDRFIGNDKLYNLATEKIKEINAAWEIVENFYHNKQNKQHENRGENNSKQQKKEHSSEKEDNNEIFPTEPKTLLEHHWIKFWTTYYVPVIAISDALTALYIRNTLSVIPFALALLYTTVIYGLRQGKKWAWELNWIVLILSFLLNASIIFRTECTGFIQSILITAIIWLLPNTFYWNKHKHLFK